MSKAPDDSAAVERILSQPYTHELVRDPDGSWFARILEFVGCMTTGSSEAEALSNLHDAMKAWVTDALAEGDAIPEPAGVDQYSGKFMVRVPKSLHRDLARRADAEGVSLNALVTAALATTLAGRKSDAPPATISYLKGRATPKRRH